MLALAAALALAGPPNIVLMIGDDMAWSDYGFMGHPHIKTPRLDRLASEGLAFTRGYVPASLCSPSLASMLTGRYPHRHGVACNDPPGKRGTPGYAAGREQLSKFIEDLPTLPKLLAGKGYRSLQTGKWWQGHYKRGGFTHGMTRGDEVPNGRHGDAGLDIGRKTLQPVADFIAESVKAQAPFFVWYAPMMPHSPHTPPERLLAKYRPLAPSLPIAKYWAMCEWHDEQCGAVLDLVAKAGAAENTIVVHVADNGWIQDPAKPNLYAPRSKQSPYDGGLRTPILVKWPGKLKPRRDDTVPVSSLDLFPTLLNAAGVPLPPETPGLDLADAAALGQRNAAFGACFTHDGVDLAKPERGVRWRWLVAGDWKLIVPNPAQEPAGQPELFHLSDDPQERKNLFAAEPARAAELRKRLDAWWPASP